MPTTIFPDENKHYALVNQDNGMVATYDKRKTFGGYPIIQARLRMASAGYKEDEVNWKFNKLSSNNTAYTISSKNAGTCMDAATFNYGIKLMIVHKPNGQENQVFHLIPTGEKNTFYISCAQNGLVLELVKRKPENEREIDVQDYVILGKISGSKSQKWKLIQVD